MAGLFTFYKCGKNWCNYCFLPGKFKNKMFQSNSDYFLANMILCECYPKCVTVFALSFVAVSVLFYIFWCHEEDFIAIY